MMWHWYWIVAAVCTAGAACIGALTGGTGSDGSPYSSWQTAPFEAMAADQKIVDPVGMVGGKSTGVHTLSQCGQCGTIPANHPACCLGVPGTKILVDKSVANYGFNAYSPDGGGFTTKTYNTEYGHVTEKIIDKKPQPVVQKDYTGRKFQ